ncbi:hypothetical protein MRB53_037295 [Persea americana]|nr:hypothetical protein MRB53_037295 [Persea americana]
MVGLLPQALISALALGALAAPAADQLANCKSVHIILARGTDNDPNTDALRGIASQVQQHLDAGYTSDVVELDYPASEGENGSPTYPASIQQGQTALTNDIAYYASGCGYSKIVLIGYSQGAQVIGNVLCGATDEGLGITPTQPLAAKYQHAIWASVWLGDPAHNPNQPWNVGAGSNGTHGVGVSPLTSHRLKLFPGTLLTFDQAYSRSDSYACDWVTGRLNSYCSQGDRYCDSKGAVPPGQDPTTIHEQEIGTWASQAAQYIISRVN